MRSRACGHGIETYPLHKSTTHQRSASHLEDSQEKGELEARMERKQIGGIRIVNRVISPVPPIVHNHDNTVSELVGINNSYTAVLSWRYHVEFHVGQNQT